MSAPILITVPKYVAISPSPMPRNLQPSPAPSDSGTDCPRGKKRRLDHLTWEEKLQRKKLKNRVAAQTSRDRKKARMEDMDYTISLLTQKTEILQNKCDSLQAINESLLSKNQKLDSQVEQLQKELEILRQEQQKADETSAVRANDNVGYGPKNQNGSAESKYPLPKGLGPKSTPSSDRKDKSAALWQIIALCLLYKTCSKISMPASLKSSPKVYSQISQKTWKEAIQQATRMLPKVQAQRSDCLDQWWGPQQSTWNPAKISCTV